MQKSYIKIPSFIFKKCDVKSRGLEELIIVAAGNVDPLFPIFCIRFGCSWAARSSFERDEKFSPVRWVCSAVQRDRLGSRTMLPVCGSTHSEAL